MERERWRERETSMASFRREGTMDQVLDMRSCALARDGTMTPLQQVLPSPSS